MGSGEISHQAVKLFPQSAQALEDRNPSLIDGDKFVKRHTLNGITLLENVMCQEITLRGFTSEEMEYLFEKA
jgi:hypothetical protein